MKRRRRQRQAEAKRKAKPDKRSQPFHDGGFYCRSIVSGGSSTD
jgi:hypothetical protein